MKCAGYKRCPDPDAKERQACERSDKPTHVGCLLGTQLLCRPHTAGAPLACERAGATFRQRFTDQPLCRSLISCFQEVVMPSQPGHAEGNPPHVVVPLLLASVEVVTLAADAASRTVTKHGLATASACH